MGRTSLLSLPAELRSMIFSSALQTIHCKYAVVVWDHISIARTEGSPSSGIGILLACRTTYQDCIALLYNNAVLHCKVRGDTRGPAPYPGMSLGPIGKCALLERLRHVQLEISFKASKSETVERVVERIRKLTKAFTRSENLKSIELIFFDEGSRWRVSEWPLGNEADPVIKAAMKFECEMMAVSRNDSASWNMSASKWTSLRERAGESDEDQEDLREITCDYWEHSWR